MCGRLWNSLTEEIKSALRLSNKLIVVCSPDSKNSLWVNAKIDFFVQEKGVENVIIFLVAGTPAESFSDVILKTHLSEQGPFIGTAKLLMAADLRPTSVYSSYCGTVWSG
jgi:hypothetical protein